MRFCPWQKVQKFRQCVKQIPGRCPKVESRSAAEFHASVDCSSTGTQTANILCAGDLDDDAVNLHITNRHRNILNCQLWECLTWHANGLQPVCQYDVYCVHVAQKLSTFYSTYTFVYIIYRYNQYSFIIQCLITVRTLFSPIKFIDFLGSLRYVYGPHNITDMNTYVSFLTDISEKKHCKKLSRDHFAMPQGDVPFPHWTLYMRAHSEKT